MPEPTDAVVAVDEDACLNCGEQIARNRRASGVIGDWWHVYSGHPECASRRATPTHAIRPVVVDPLCSECGWEQSHCRHHDPNLYNYHVFKE
jgi:hypothetical protein